MKPNGRNGVRKQIATGIVRLRRKSLANEWAAQIAFCHGADRFFRAYTHSHLVESSYLPKGSNSARLLCGAIFEVTDSARNRSPYGSVTDEP